MSSIDLKKTIEELEKFAEPEPTYQSGLIMRIHKLRKVRLCDYSLGDLRVTLLQQLYLEWLVPLAIQQLEIDPLSEGDFYPGDLLHAVLTIPEAYWNGHAKQKILVQKIVKRVDFGDDFQADNLVHAMQPWLNS